MSKDRADKVFAVLEEVFCDVKHLGGYFPCVANPPSSVDVHESVPVAFYWTPEDADEFVRTGILNLNWMFNIRYQRTNELPAPTRKVVRRHVSFEVVNTLMYKLLDLGLLCEWDVRDGRPWNRALRIYGWEVRGMTRPALRDVRKLVVFVARRLNRMMNEGEGCEDALALSYQAARAVDRIAQSFGVTHLELIVAATYWAEKEVQFNPNDDNVSNWLYVAAFIRQCAAITTKES